EKKKDEVRPYLIMRDFCLEKDKQEYCSAQGFTDLTKLESKLIEENVIKICKSFEGERNGSAVCQLQVQNNRKSRTLSKLVNSYQKRFKSERFNKLFSLRSTHQKFSCEKDVIDRTQMEIKILNRGWNTTILETLIQFVNATWSRENFILSLSLVEEMGSDVVEIVPTSGGVSYVPDNNTRRVYLSTNLDFETQKKVLAHEFGHVLGFPDCYIEYFDKGQKTLIYYELENGDTNIMCTLKAGVNVPISYLEELSQKSCVFP
ncbi:MAG: hypothetical protein K2Q18_04360, partial [Bdellovibrionales bacterium]|nr:hypothetical protein [Bdellovibrionales bacterium]